MDLWLYRSLSRIPRLNYRAKIMVTAFLGTHVPLFALITFVASENAADWRVLLAILAVALAATLAGTVLTLFVLHHLLRPVLLTSRALRVYRTERRVDPLPAEYRDEVGTLMADAGATLDHLEAARVRLEHFDESTGLANRDRLRLDIASDIARAAPFALCGIEMTCHDRMARALDAAAAEAAVRQMARRLEGFLGPAAGLARIGTERFAFLLRPTPTARDDASAPEAADATVAETLQDLLMQCGSPLAFGGLSVRPDLTGGVARFPQDAEEPEALLDQATAAAAMTGRGSRVAFHSPQARAELLDRYRIEEALRTALREDQFVLHYQPVVDLAAGRTVGAEALIRWQHPEAGLLPPARFIPAAEAAGLIRDIGLWVLDAACAQVARWDAAGLGDLRVAVNVSAHQFQDPTLLEHVRGALGRHAVTPDRLEIELTESAAMDDEAHSRTVFGRLRDLGVGIAIDDFGTGFASLSYLRRLPFDKLKLDREFVTDVDRRPESQAICAALIALADGLGLRVLAEGTEREAEVHHLFDRGCTLFQGYYLGRPVPAEAFAAAAGSARIAEVAARLGKPGLRHSA